MLLMLFFFHLDNAKLRFFLSIVRYFRPCTIAIAIKSVHNLPLLTYIRSIYFFVCLFVFLTANIPFCHFSSQFLFFHLLVVRKASYHFCFHSIDVSVKMHVCVFVYFYLSSCLLVDFFFFNFVYMYALLILSFIGLCLFSCIFLFFFLSFLLFVNSFTLHDLLTSLH